VRERKGERVNIKWTHSENTMAENNTNVFLEILQSFDVGEFILFAMVSFQRL